jgi:hypothetical protein
VEPMKCSHCADYDRLAGSDIERDELTRDLRLLEHARHVPAVGALKGDQPRLARDAHHFVHRGSTAWAWQSTAVAPASG